MVAKENCSWRQACWLGLSGAALAHHSGAAYDTEHPQTMEGTVKTVNWTNPHITFVIEADAKDGKPAQTWVFEVSSPGVLTRSGWTKRSLQPGDHAVFHYAPLRAGNPGGFLMKVDSAGRQGTELQPARPPINNVMTGRHRRRLFQVARGDAAEPRDPDGRLGHSGAADHSYSRRRRAVFFRGPRRSSAVARAATRRAAEGRRAALPAGDLAGVADPSGHRKPAHHWRAAALAAQHHLLFQDDAARACHCADRRPAMVVVVGAGILGEEPRPADRRRGSRRPLSILVWCGIIFAGRWIAYTQVG